MKLGLKFNFGERKRLEQESQEYDARIEQELQAEIGKIALIFDWPLMLHFSDGRPDITGRIYQVFPDRVIYEAECGGFASDVVPPIVDSDSLRRELR